MRRIVDRTLLAFLLALLVFWAAGIAGGALKAMTTRMGPSPHPCVHCVIHWR